MTVIEELEPTIANPVTVTFSYGGSNIEYTQRPLSFFGKMELFSVLGNAVQKALSEDGVSISHLLDIPQRDGEAPLSARDFIDADTFIRAIAALTQFAPDLLKDVYCISLAVPRQERPFIKEIMEEQLSDEDGVALLGGFIEQNWEVMKSFFYEQIQPLVERVSQTVRPSTPLKPSKTTRRRTQKQ